MANGDATWSFPGRLPPAIRGHGVEFIGTTCRRPKSHCSGTAFYIAYIESSATLKPGRQWDAWYAYLTEKHGFSKKPVFVGMSRGGEYSYLWATAHPDEVSGIVPDNPEATRKFS